MPVVLRISVGSKYGAQHSQDWTALVHHIPGLKVVYPVTPYDAKGMMNSALAGTDPVVFTEVAKPAKVPRMPSGVEIVLPSGHVVRVPAGAESDTLRRVLQTMQTTC